MSISLTRILQQITGLNTFFAGPSASRDNGVVLLDTATVTWGTDGQGNIQATAAGGTLPTATGAGQVLTATGPGTTYTAQALPVGSASQGGIVEVDGTTITATAGVISAATPANIAFTNVANSFTANQSIASGSGLILNGSHEWEIFSNSGAQALWLQDVSNGGFYPLIVHSNDGQTVGPMTVSNGGFTWSAGSGGQGADTTFTRPSAGIVQVGTSGTGANASGALLAAFHTTGAGAQLTAAATIAPTNSIHHVTGTTTIETITVPALVTAGWQLTLIPDVSGVNWGTTGNIGLAGTISAADHAITFTWDGTKFYPSAIA